MTTTASTSGIPQQRAKTEQSLRDAMERLFNGQPRCTDGRLIKNNLYKEARVSRATINRATSVLAEWDARLAERSPAREPRSDQEKIIQGLRADLKKATELARQLQQKVDAAATVIGALHSDNTALRNKLSGRSAPVVSLDLARANRE